MAAFIVYGSLYPFAFRSLPDGMALPDVLVGAWQLHRPGRGDLAANLLLYSPLGLALTLGLAPRIRAVPAACLALLCCCLLSASMEIGQLFVPRRTPSGWDLVLNALGAACGATAGAILAPRGWQGAPAWRPTVADVFPALLLGCWLGYRLYSYIPVFDLDEWRVSLEPLRPPWNPDPLRTLRLAILWLVAARFLDAARPRGENGFLLAAVMLATLAAAVPIVERRLTVEEIIAVGVALPAWVLLRGRRLTDGLLFAALLLAVLLEGAQPYRLLSEPRAFGWIPLRSVMSGHWGNGLQAMLYKFMLYGGLVWFGMRVGLGYAVAGMLAVAVAVGISVLQTWLPGRSAEITDALLAAGAVLTLRLVSSAAPAGRPPVAEGRSA